MRFAGRGGTNFFFEKEKQDIFSCVEPCGANLTLATERQEICPSKSKASG
jgi:hypothetical protein